MRASSNVAAIIVQRSLHLVDLENLIGDPFAPADVALCMFRCYLDVADWRPGDHLILASNPGLMSKIIFDLPVPCSPHTACGRDGADRKLLSFASPDHVARRFERLVVGSGDGIFAARAESVRELGTRVLVVARADGCSGRLRRFDHRLLDPVVIDELAA